MDYPSSVGRRPGAFSPMTNSTNTGSHVQSRPAHRRSHSSGSDSSSSSQLTAMSGGGGKRAVYAQNQRPPILSTTSSSSSSSSLQTTAVQHPSITHVIGDAPLSRKNSPLNPGTDRTHKRNNSQGFFEPSLPSAGLMEQNGGAVTLSASQIAAQAAMQHQGSHSRKRSQTVPSPLSPPDRLPKLRPPPLPSLQPSSARKAVFNGQFGSPAATSAASVAHQRGQLSPGMTSFAEVPSEKEKEKLKHKMKLFSKPKHIGIPGYKDDKSKPLPSSSGRSSPAPGMLYKNYNASSTSLIDSVPPSAAASIYTISNASASTLVAKPEEKTHRNFLSRQKHKLKDKMDDHSLILSSAASNSKPVNPEAPGSIYSFAPSSPGPAQGSFSKSVSGLDIRHGGRALREKREKDADWLGASGLSTVNPAPLSVEFNYGNLQGFGLSNMTADEAWEFLKAKILIIFEGEELKMPVEDLNKLVSVHIQRSVQRKIPALIIEDLEDLLRTGFLSLDQTLRGVPDDKLIPTLVDMWLFVFGTILPYIQAVFLPLDLEFRGTGTILSPQDAVEFWGLDAKDDLDVRRMVLLSYRDSIILPKHDVLKAIFSRLSLESINVDVDSPLPIPSPRPGSSDPASSSYNSQGSTLLSDGSRSRATSNTSAPELFTPAPLRNNVQQRQNQGVQVTETVGRVLQCMSVLASLRSDDEAQAKIEEITKALKLNWFGRGRTGRNRRGFVGARMPRINRI